MSAFLGFQTTRHIHKNEEHLANDAAVEFLQIEVPYRQEKVFTTIYWPKDKPVKADILILHGIDGCGAFFAKYSARDLLQRGYRVTVPDLPGHGRTACNYNPKSHGLYSDIAVFPEVVNLLLTQLVKRYSPSESGKTFLAGKSLGGMHLVNYLARYQDQNDIDGAVFICPAIKLSADAGHICPDPQFEIDFYADPLNYRGSVKMASGLAIMDSFATMKDKLANITVPFLVIHGEGDRATNIEGSKDLYATAKSLDKKLITYPNVQHIIFHELPSAMLDVIGWMDNRLAAKMAGTESSETLNQLPLSSL
ncbi:hypothetical protein HDU91_001909 [Kappamyces sp. JEL0680]|nr:hypothetical protein HDU91_001909 [Kappamyces sp. JEL0680]